MPEKEATEKEKKFEALLQKGLKAFGIDKKYVVGTAEAADGAAVIVTAGGTKVRYKDGDEVEKLDPVRVDGISRKPKKVILGKKK